jgi:hypothetical protein
VREATDRSQYIVENDQDRRDRANLQLKGVKQARAVKGC